MTLRSRTAWTLCAALIALAIVPVAAHAQCCIASDNGTGTATLPPSSSDATCVYLGTMEIVDGLPAGTTIQIAATIGNFNNVIETAGGGLGGTTSTWNGQLTMQMTGTGTLSSFSRNITVPLTGTGSNVIEWAPRMLAAPVQNANAQVYFLFGQNVMIGDPDFDFLRVTAGSGYGLPSPGQIQLALSGGGWAAWGFFDLTHRIDFIGAPGGALAGMSGSTTRQRHFEICPGNTVGVEPSTWSNLKSIYR